MENKSWTNRMRPVRWCYDFELAERNQKNDLLMLTTGMFQFLLHKGNLLLSEKGLLLLDNLGATKEEIPFEQIETVYLGYDDLYPPKLSKNWGAFWAPLRITLKSGAQIYLIIYGSMGLIIRNKAWFNYLQKALS